MKYISRQASSQLAKAKAKINGVNELLSTATSSVSDFKLARFRKYVALSSEPRTFSLPVNALFGYQIQFAFDPNRTIRTGKDSLFTFSFSDSNGAAIAPPYAGLAFSQKVGAYRYITPDDAGKIEFTVPRNAASATIGVRLWDAKQPIAVSRELRVAIAVRKDVEKGLKDALFHINQTVAALAKAPADRSAGKTLAVSAMDEISNLNWGSEIELIFLKKNDYAQQIRTAGAQMMLLESAWRANGGEWEYAFTSPDLKHANAQAMVEAMQIAKGKMPIAFWNKEDPLHYEKFLPIAEKADHIFTTDSACVDRYKADLKAKSVTVLPFAANFAVSNPSGRATAPQEGVCFAGSFYSEGHEERKRQMEYMLEPIREFGGAIYDRFSHLKNDRYAFPQRFQSFIRPSVGFSEMAQLYKRFKVFLNVNTIVTSETMMSRRVYELLASGTPVVSAPSLAIERQLDGIVQVASTEKEANEAVHKLLNDDLFWRKTSHLGVRRIASEHQYSHRANLINEIVLGKKTERQTGPAISVIMATMRSSYLPRILTNLSRQQGVNFEVIFALTGKWLAAEKKKLSDLAVKNKNIRAVKIIECDGESILGDNLNRAGREASAPIISKMDDDDFYFENYLRDVVKSFDMGDFDVVGKQSHAVYLESDDALIWKSPNRRHCTTHFVSGPTISVRQEMFEMVKFPSLPRGEDTEFLKLVTAHGGTIYSSDEFNFVQYRAANSEHHTWQVGNDTFIKNGKLSGSWDRIDDWIV